MNHFLQQLDLALQQVAKTEPIPVESKRFDTATEKLERQIVLDPSKDPDPYGYHKMSMSYRLQCMGWK